MVLKVEMPDGQPFKDFAVAANSLPTQDADPPTTSRLQLATELDELDKAIELAEAHVEELKNYRKKKSAELRDWGVRKRNRKAA